MASDEDIRQFIEQQRANGAFDSSGRFSIDLRKAQVKSELATGLVPAFHVLKLVQAAVLGNFANIEVSTNRIRIGGRLILSLKQTLEWLAKPGLPADPSERCLVEGLRGCLAVAEGPVELLWQGQRALVGENKIEEVGWDYIHDMEIRLPRKPKLEQRAAESRELELRCGYCPVAVEHEGRELGHENPHGCRARPPCVAFWNDYTHPSYLLALRQMAPSDKSGFRVQAQRELAAQLPNFDSSHSVFLLARDRGCETSGAVREISLPLSLDGPNLVKFVHYGIVLETVNCDLGVPGAHAVVSANHLQTDISGFKLVRDQAYQDLVTSLREDTVSLARQARERLQDFRLPEEPKAEHGLLTQLMIWVFRAGETRPEDRTPDCREKLRELLAKI